MSQLIKRNITRPLLHVVEIARQIAEGHMNVPRPVRTFQDGIGQLHTSIQLMSERLRKFALDIRTVAKHVVAGSQMMSSRTETVSQGYAEQAAASAWQVVNKRWEQNKLVKLSSN